MLRGISPLLSPEILKLLAEMGHQDRIVFGDANFPAERYKKYGSVVLRADGITIPDLLDAILPLFPLDTYTDKPILLMEVPSDQAVDTPIWDEYKKIAEKYEKRGANVIGTLERNAYYAACKDIYAVIQTGETAIYANVMLQKGIV